MNDKDRKKSSEKEDQKKPQIRSRWDLDSYKAADQRKGIYDWSRKDY